MMIEFILIWFACGLIASWMFLRLSAREFGHIYVSDVLVALICFFAGPFSLAVMLQVVMVIRSEPLLNVVVWRKK